MQISPFLNGWVTDNVIISCSWLDIYIRNNKKNVFFVTFLVIDMQPMKFASSSKPFYSPSKNIHIRFSNMQWTAKLNIVDSYMHDLIYCIQFVG